MRVRKIYVPSAGAAVADSFVAATDTTADTPLTLEAAAASIDPPREILFTTDGDMTDVTVTIVGKNRRGMDQTEQVVLANAGTSSSRGVYSSITSITPDTTNANNVEVGTPQRVTSPWYMLNTVRSVDYPQSASGQTIDTDDGEVNAADGKIEYTLQNVARDGELVAYGQSLGIIDDSVGTSFEIPVCAFFRVVNDAAVGTVAVAVVRPSF